jgi:hypothetical protein
LINVEKCDTHFDLQNDPILYNSSRGVIIDLLSENNNSLSNMLVFLEFNNRTLTAFTDAEGKIILDITGLKTGIYTLCLEFSGSENYKAIETDFIIEIVPQLTYIEVIEEEQEVRIYLYDSENRTLPYREIEIHYVSENGTISFWKELRTNSKGYISVDFDSKDLPEKVNKLQLIFNGERLYKNSWILIDISNILEIGKGILANMTWQSLLGIFGALGLVTLFAIIRRKRIKSFGN